VSTSAVVPSPLVGALPSRAGEIEVDLADAVHCRAVDARLAQAIARGARSLDEALAVTEGADPRLVAQRMRALGWAPPAAMRSAAGDTAQPWDPELHARDFEWYFTRECAAGLAARAGGPGRSVLCLGTPTVAFALLEAPGLRRVTLVDRNPLALRRRHHHAAALEAWHDDLAAARVPAGAYDAAVLDAPWYPDALRHWLDVAAAAVRPGGTVLLALLPALHRPSAPADRATVLAHARALGRVAIDPGRLRYATPRFEHEALATAGLSVPAAWRRADLLELTVERPPAPPVGPVAPAREPAWVRFVIGPQVIHLDPHAPTEPGDALAPIDGRADFRYGSISTRDPRRATIGLWTSRSRVARVRRPELVAALLERLAAAGQRRALDHAPELGALPADERARLRRALHALLGPALD
jgi:hypothetical protein